MKQGEQLQKLLETKQAERAAYEASAAERHAKGVWTARERVEKLLEPGTFVETDAMRTEAAVVTGYGLVDGRPVYVAAQDAAVRGAAMSVAQAEKILKILSLAGKTGAPVVLFVDSDGLQVREGAAVLSDYARVFAAMSRLSGICPIITVISGKAFGVAAHFATLSDISIAVEKHGLLAAQSPSVLRAMAGTSLKDEEICGAAMLAKQGLCAKTAATEDEALALAARFIGLLPSFNGEAAPQNDDVDLNRLLNEDSDTGLRLALDVADENTAVELYEQAGDGVSTLLCRVGGYTCGLISGNGDKDGGRLDASDLRKAARMVRLCDCFHLPIISLVDSEGLKVPDYRHQGSALRASSQLLYAFSEAVVPKVAVLTGNAVGAAYIAMGGRAMADITFAWPGAVVAPLNKETAVQTFEAARLENEERAALEQEYAAANDGIMAAKIGLADDVIDPRQTRKHIIAALELLLTKQESKPAREHGNMPL